MRSALSLVACAALAGPAAAQQQVSTTWSELPVSLLLPSPGETLALSLDPGDDCRQSNWLAGCVDEAGHYTAIRITPPTTPFLATDITYPLFHKAGIARGADCDADIEHEAFVFVHPTDEPLPVDPIELERFTVPPDGGGGQTRLVTLQPFTPIYVGPGESLVVAVQMAGNPLDPAGNGCLSGGSVLCIDACVSYDDIGEDSFWSFAAEPPYQWKAFDQIDWPDGSAEAPAWMAGITIGQPCPPGAAKCP